MSTERTEDFTPIPRSFTGSPHCFWAVLIIISLWRIIAAVRLDLCLDESYYHYWSLFPQLSYFDHPPFTAWSMHLLSYAFGNSLWTVRFWPVLTAAAFALTGRALAGRMFENAETGNRAGILLLLTPVFIGNGLLMTPDTFMAVFWALALYCTWRAISPGNSFFWWIGTGVCVGFGFLTKYNMVLFFPSLGFFWLFAPQQRRPIFIGSVIVGVIALLIFSPVLWWNHQHDWISFRFQLNHGFSSNSHSALQNFLGYLGGLLLLSTPILGGLAFWSCAKGSLSPQPQKRFLAAFFWIIIFFFGYSSLKTRGQMNWAMLAFFSGMILVAQDWPGYARGWRRAAMGLLMVCNTLIMSYLLLPAKLPLGEKWLTFDERRTREFFGAETITQSIKSKFQETGADFLCTSSHQLFGRLSFYTPELRGVLWELQDGRYRYPWIKDEQWKGKTALWVSQYNSKEDIQKYFKNVVALGTLNASVGKTSTEKLYLFQAVDYQPDSVPVKPDCLP